MGSDLLKWSLFLTSQNFKCGVKIKSKFDQLFVCSKKLELNFLFVKLHPRISS